MNNLDIYEAVRSVPKEATKPFNNGSFSGTDINPMWRIKTLTEMFGPVGIGWYYTINEHWSEDVADEIITHVVISLFVKYNGEWSMPIVGIGGNKSLQQFRGKSGEQPKTKISDEGYKMALTDAISVAAKALGIGADVYWEQDKTKYTKYAEEPKQSEREQTICTILAGSKWTLADAQKSAYKAYGKADVNSITEDQFKELCEKLKGATAK